MMGSNKELDLNSVSKHIQLVQKYTHCKDATIVLKLLEENNWDIKVNLLR